MIQRMRRAQLLRRATEQNAWGEQVEEWVESGRVDMALSTLTGDTAPVNSVLSAASTHVGLVWPGTVRIGDKLCLHGHTYRVNYIVPARRMDQLLLSSEEALT